MGDPVNHPDHYLFDNGVEVIDLTEQLNFNCGNVVKYVARAGRKTESPLEDLEKARFYLNREIARQGGWAFTVPDLPDSKRVVDMSVLFSGDHG